MTHSDKSDERQRILIWGAGAIGGTVAAYLARAGLDITVVDANEAHVGALRRTGIQLTGPIESFTQVVPCCLPDGVEGTWDTIFLSTKALHTEDAVRQLLPHLSRQGLVVSLQNGLNELAIADVVGPSRTLGAFVNFGADVLEPGVIHFGGRGAVVVGELDGRSSQRANRVVQALRHFEPNAVATDNVWGYLWGKMGYGALLFAGALTNASIVDSLLAPDARPALIELAREVTQVAAAEGVTPMGFNGFDPDAFSSAASPTAVDATFAAMVAFNQASAKTHSGIWRDLAVHHRKTEIDAQFGPILRIARRRGIPAPAIEALVELMHEVESGDRPLAWSNLLELPVGNQEGAPGAHPL